MMDHRAEALRLLESCQVDPGDERDAPTYPELEDGVNSIANGLAAAQVHALLAVADAIRGPVPASPVAVEGSEPARQSLDVDEVPQCACGEPLGNSWFDREVCADPCGQMHTRCNNCGKAQGGCPHEKAWPLADVLRERGGACGDTQGGDR